MAELAIIERARLNPGLDRVDCRLIEVATTNALHAPGYSRLVCKLPDDLAVGSARASGQPDGARRYLWSVRSSVWHALAELESSKASRPPGKNISC